MAFGQLGRLGAGGFGTLGGSSSRSPASYGSGPAPAGYHWEFVTSNGERVTSNGEPVVALVGN